MAVWRDSDGAYHHGAPPLFDNVTCENADHRRSAIKTANGVCANAYNPRLRSRPLALLVDSEALDKSDAQLPKAFHDAAEDELEAFRREYAARNPGDEPDDAEILREVMNTVGKPDELGGPIRLVVSLSMLTEGGCQHRHPHPRDPGFLHPTHLRTGRRAGAAAGVLRAR